MSDTETATQRVGQLLKARYRIERVLHVGAQHCVYAGTDTKLTPPTRVAIKLLGPERAHEPSEPALRARFVQRGYLGNAVGHPGAVTALDTGTTEDGASFLVMELLEAPSLLTLRATHGGKLPLRLACAIADQCLDLLACAHSQKIFHGAITPEKLFWERGSQLRALGFGSSEPPLDPTLARARDLEAVAALWHWLLGEASAPARLRAVFESPSTDAEQLRRALERAHRAELGSRIEASWGPDAPAEATQPWLRIWLVAVGLAAGVLFLTSIGSERTPRPAARHAPASEPTQTETGLAAATAEPQSPAAEQAPAPAAPKAREDVAVREPPEVPASSEPAVETRRPTARGPSLEALRTPMLPESAAHGGDARRVPGPRPGLSPLATAPRLCTELAARARRAPDQPLSEAERRAWDEHCQKH